MPITISDTSLVIDGSKATWTVPSPLLFMGEIMRLFNSSSTTQTYNYTGIDGITATATVSATTSSYILVKSGSATDSWNETTQIAAIKLFITSSELGNPFTEELITTTGAGSWTKPTGVTQVVVECWGGGGSGGGASNNQSGGGGGAGGQYARRYIQYSSPSQNISYFLGAGGIGNTGLGGTGEPTDWDSPVKVRGYYGDLGLPNGLEGNPAAGGIGSIQFGIGDVVYPGNSGVSGEYFGIPINVAIGGRGGGGAGSTTGSVIQDNFGEREYGGDGGDGISATAQGINGNPGNNYGAGGSGAAKISGASRSGGDGAQGLIRILYR